MGRVPPPSHFVGPSLPRFAGEGKEAPSTAKRGRVGEGATEPYDTTIRGAARAGPWSPAIFSHTRWAMRR